MRTLIVGCGYLGRRVGKQLVDKGRLAFGTTRSVARGPELRALGIQPIVADVMDTDSLSGLPAVDRVLYCVSFDRKSGHTKREVYVEGLRRALSRLLDRSKLFVYASSTSVYGQTDGSWVDESSPTEPVTESGRICLDAESVVKEVCEARGLPWMVLRFSGLYGPGRLIRRESLLRGEPVAAEPDTYLNLIQIDDAAAACVAAFDRGKSASTYIVTDDRPIFRREYYELAARLIGAPAPTFEPTGEPSGHKRLSNRRLREELGFEPSYSDITTGIPAALAADAPRGH